MMTPGRIAAIMAPGLGAILLIPALVTGGMSSSAKEPPATRCDMADGRAAIPQGIVLLGEDGDPRPGRKVTVPAFWMDRHEVTNRQWTAFVVATGYRTQAEREGGSAVFVQPGGPVPLDDITGWWRFVEGADWQHPQGPDSDITGKDDLPVVHVDREDAEAYAKWAGGQLPTEAQWERAARGRQDKPLSPTSWAFGPDGKPRANVWEGVFPVRDTGDDGFKGMAPVGCFPANDFGMHDMVGNAWEWTAVEGPNGLVKGGSFLCAMNYCANFRPAAFQAQERDLGTSHIGFRVAYPRPS